MKAFIKSLIVPASNETKQIEVVDAWVVRWWGTDEYRWGGDKPRAEIFMTKQQAADFAVSLRDAFSLLRIKGQRTDITVEPAS